MSLDRKIEPPRVSPKLGQFGGEARAGRFRKQVWFYLSKRQDNSYGYGFCFIILLSLLLETPGHFIPSGAQWQEIPGQYWEDCDLTKIGRVHHRLFSVGCCGMELVCPPPSLLTLSLLTKLSGQRSRTPIAHRVSARESAVQTNSTTEYTAQVLQVTSRSTITLPSIQLG